MVSAACGVMNSLLQKLASLLEKEYMLLIILLLHADHLGNAN